MTQHVADNVGVLDALDVTDAVVIGHDWGAPIAWTSALLRPDRIPRRRRAVGALGAADRPSTTGGVPLRSPATDEFYIEYFQQPGRAEAEIEADVRSWLRGFYFTASGDVPPAVGGGGPWRSSPAARRCVTGSPCPTASCHGSATPTWTCTSTSSSARGFVGPLNRYRNIDRDWEDMQAMRGRPIEVPALFIGGDRDGPTLWGRRNIERFPETVPGHAWRAHARGMRSLDPAGARQPTSTPSSSTSSPGCEAELVRADAPRPRSTAIWARTLPFRHLGAYNPGSGAAARVRRQKRVWHRPPLSARALTLRRDVEAPDGEREHRRCRPRGRRRSTARGRRAGSRARRSRRRTGW